MTWHIIIKLVKTEKQEKIFILAKEKYPLTHKGKQFEWQWVSPQKVEPKEVISALFKS